MGRVQLAINVTDLDRAIEFYSKLFQSGPAKVREGYANFALDEPPLKLVLMEGGQGGTLNHLGVEVFSTEDVAEATNRLKAEGLATREEKHVSCCYAIQDKVWVSDPDGAPWEVYTMRPDHPQADLCSDSSCQPVQSDAGTGTGTRTDIEAKACC